MKNTVDKHTELFEKWRSSVPDLNYQHDRIGTHGIYKFHPLKEERGIFLNDAFLKVF